MKKTKKQSNKAFIIIMIFLIVIVGLWIVLACTTRTNKTISQDTDMTGTAKSTQHEGIISLEIVGPEEEPKDEKWEYAPAEISAISEKDGKTFLTLDMLTMNPDYQPGVTDYFLNKNPKLRELPIANDAKAFNCNNTAPSIPVAVKDTVTAIGQSLSGGTAKVIYYFDINDGKINTIYQSCLP